MTKAIRIHAHGGPEVLRWESLPTPEPGPGEALVRHEAVGLNFIDVYFRTGLYKSALPATIGMEAAGVVVAVGDGVDEVTVGDRVAYATAPIGAYATERVIAAARLVRLPDDIDFQTGAAMMLQGLTAQYLIRRTHRVSAGETILVHAAAGGVGLILTQWAKHLGATVIGTAGDDEKCAMAKAHGAAHCINYKKDDFVAKVKELTGGTGVPVVYDSVGKDTFIGSLDSLAPMGLMVTYGNASGPVPPVDVATLAAKGSLFLTRPNLATYTAKRADLENGANELFEVVRSGAVSIRVNQTFPLADAAKAHEALEARRTTGSTVLLP